MISSAEWEVMRVLWAKSEATSGEICKILAAKQGWSASTVKTLLGRLAEKGLVSSYRLGRAFQYRATVSEAVSYERELEAVFAKICVTKHTRLLAKQLEKTPMTLVEIEAIERLLLAKKQGAVTQVICDCLPGQCQCVKGDCHER